MGTFGCIAKLTDRLIKRYIDRCFKKSSGIRQGKILANGFGYLGENPVVINFPSSIISAGLVKCTIQLT